MTRSWHLVLLLLFFGCCKKRKGEEEGELGWVSSYWRSWYSGVSQLRGRAGRNVMAMSRQLLFGGGGSGEWEALKIRPKGV